MTWLRPWWLLALVPIVPLAWQILRSQVSAGQWRQVIDPALQPFVLDGEGGSKRAALLLLPLTWTLAVLVLAGPVWQRVPVPAFQSMAAEVLLLDMSASMRTTDVPPDRFQRAHYKLLDILDRSAGRQVGLIAFAERPYVISPLTQDRDTLRDFVPSLSPEIVPVQGSRLDLAIDRASELLAAAGVSGGEVIALTDNPADARARAAATRLAGAGHRLSILAVGTAAGAPLKRADGHFIKDAAGAIVVPQLDIEGLRALAALGGGVAVVMQLDSTDLDALGATREQSSQLTATKASAERVYWREWGYWLLPVFVAGALSLFRRGVL